MRLCVQTNPPLAQICGFVLITEKKMYMAVETGGTKGVRRFECFG